MEKKFTILVFIAVLLLQGFWMKAQEQLVPLHANNSLISFPSAVKSGDQSRTATIPALDTIPFFDDFSYSTTSPYPTANHWIDSNVFINHTFPIAAPSIGVATFDGLNKRGYPYNLSASSTSSAPADKLTSRPINLQKKGAFVYTPSDSIYLSFYYQAGGRGYEPSANDSLSLDFYKPNQKKWVTVWRRKGYLPTASDSLFHLVMMPIKDTAYFDSLFQFRFRGRATLSGSLDHWHIDYIRIDRNRSYADSGMEDNAFQYMSSSFLKNYSTMPYRQYQPWEMAPSVQNYMRNNFTSTKNMLYNYTVFDINNVPVNSYNGGSANILPYQTNGLHNALQHSRPPVPFAFPAPMTGMGIYTIKHVISSSPDLQRQNDTIFQTQRFSDYYAYDDGTAECAYSLRTVYGAKLAVRYTLNAPDTLRGLRIYFDPTTDGQNIINSSFSIMVWKSGNNGPGSLIYSDNASNEHRPVYLQGKYNLMPVFYLSFCLLLDPGTYYFGIKQNTNRAMNIGFDINTNHSDAVFFDVGNNWESSVVYGSVMINPVMGCHEELMPVGVKTHQEKQSDMTIFPNPAQNTIAIESNGLLIENATVSILSSLGQVVYSTTYSSGETMDVSSLPNGIYFITISSSQLSTTPKKLVISR
jgi:hypothetical protein